MRKHHKFKYNDMAILCAIYILNYWKDKMIVSNKEIVDYLLENKLVNPIKSISENTRGRLYELEHRFNLVSGTRIPNSHGGPVTSFKLNKKGASYITKFYNKELELKFSKYRSPIEGPPCGSPPKVDNTILKDNIRNNINRKE